MSAPRADDVCLLVTAISSLPRSAVARTYQGREPLSDCGEDEGVDSLSDAEVIAASIDDPRAFGVIFDRYATLLRRYLVRRLGPQDADSILGEIFRIAFEKR